MFHVTNQGATTWYQFARDVWRRPGSTRPWSSPSPPPTCPPRPAPRPANSVLDNAALRLSGVPLLPDHHEPLERTVKSLAG